MLGYEESPFAEQIIITPGEIIEIDESAKYSRGHRVVDKIWVFGGICSRSNKNDIDAVVIQNRTADTLLDCFNQYISPGG